MTQKKNSKKAKHRVSGKPVCPKCDRELEPEAKNLVDCPGCKHPVANVMDRWKAANMGKMRGKPHANRTGKDKRNQ